MSLYQLVRPQSFEEIVGNQRTVIALKKLLESRNVPHGILLQGPTGCGKTTLARIIAKHFGSDDNSIFEINAANTNGVEAIRDIAKTANLATLGGKAKTYILDESHQLTNAAQECLLKVLEDSPKHCYFIFCTTNPENLTKTIRGRLTSFEVSPLREAEVQQLLQNACQKAGVTVSPEILTAVAVTSQGHPRNTLVALEKVMNLTDLDTAINLLIEGTDKDVKVKDLCNLLVLSPDIRKQKFSTIINIFDMIQADPETIRGYIMKVLYEYLVVETKEEVLLDLANLIRIFSGNCFYGGKSMLGSLIVQSVFLKNPFLNNS